MSVSATDLAVAFAAGFGGFVSPCVLPLVPGYLSFVGGTSAAELESKRTAVVFSTAAFVLGFGAVFTLAGAGVGLLGAQFLDHRSGLELVGGVVVMAMGVIMLASRVTFLQRQWRLPLGARPHGPVGAAATGAAFAVGWSPCVGATLGSILTIAGTSGRAGAGAELLAAYSLGLGVPFIATGLFVGSFLTAVRPLRAHLGTINRVAGGLLVATGVLLATGRLDAITARLAQ